MTAWLLGLVGGAVALAVTVLMFPLGIAMVVAIALLRPRPLPAAGGCVAWGAGFLIEMRRAEEACAAFNRQPNASCTMGDNTPFFLVGAAVLVLGAALTGYSARRGQHRRRLPDRGGGQNGLQL